MSEFELRIEELRGEVEKNLSARTAVCRELGLFLLNEAETPEGDSPMEEYRKASEEIAGRISLMDQQIAEIEELESAFAGIRESESGLKDKKKICQDNLSLLQETLGEELYHLINSQDLDVPWKAAFDPLVQNISRIRDSESEIYQVESQAREKNLLKGILRKSRMSVLKTRKKSMEHSLSKLYQNCLSDALKMGAGKGEGKDAELLAPFFRADREWQDLIVKEQALEEERTLNRERLKELSGVRGPKKRVEFLNKEKESEDLRLNEALQKWGEAVTGGTPDAWKDLPEVKEAIREIDALTEGAIQLNLDIDKWEARRDVDKLKKDREYMSSKIETLEEEIQARRQEIRVLKKEISGAEKEISKKEKFIGDPPSEEETEKEASEAEKTES